MALSTASAVVNAQTVTVVDIGSAGLSRDRIDNPRWISLDFNALTTGTHTIRVSWDSDADIRFNVRQPNGSNLSSTIKDSNPAIWTGDLNENEDYFLGIWTKSGSANFTATIEAELDPIEQSVITFGQGTLDSTNQTGPRFQRLSFTSPTTALHTINVIWDSDADVRFNVIHADGTRLNSEVVRGDSPGVWSGVLNANTEYSIGLWSRSGIANYSANLETTTDAPTDPPVTPEETVGLYSLQADTSAWMLEGPSPTLDFGDRENSAWGQVLLRNGDLLLVGGDFQGIKPSVNGAVTSRPFLAAFNAVTGQPVTSFQTPSEVDSVVRALVLSPNGEQVYAGGDFGLLAIDALTGELDFAVDVMDGNKSGRVYDIAITDSQLYIGGEFTHINNQFRGNLARLNLSGVLDSSWHPRVLSGFSTGRTTPVQAITLSPDEDVVYVGGFYSRIENTDAYKTPHGAFISMLALNASDGSVRSEKFSADVGNDARLLGVRDIAVTENYVIIAWGGPNFLSFHTSNGDRLHQYQAESDMQRLEIMGNRLFVGHHGEFIGSRTNPIPVEAVVSIVPKVFIPYKLHSFRIDDTNFPVEQTWRINGTFGVWGIAPFEDSLWISGQISVAGSTEHQVDGLAKFPILD